MDGGNELSPLLRSQTSVDLSLNGEEVTDLTGKVHQLPCGIKYDGSTSVSDYFKPKSSGMEVDGLRVEEAYFRGRKLHGTTLPLPGGYSGFILGKKSSDEKTNTETSYCWEANAKFQNVTVWNHDSLPSNDDAFLRSFHWFSVAKAIPVMNAAAPTSQCRRSGISSSRSGPDVTQRSIFSGSLVTYSC